MKAVIIAHGKFSGSEVLKTECDTADIIICADGGAEFAYKNGIKPDFLIGDFDSIEDNVFQFFIKSNVEIIRYPNEKDFTDTEICVSKAIELGSKEVCIISGIGGRFDHSLGNVGLLHILAKNKLNGYIASSDCYIYLCNRELNINGKKGQILSIIPFKEDVKGVCLSGLKYPLDNADIDFGRPIGISNEMISDKCSVRVKQGELLVIKQNIM